MIAAGLCWMEKSPEESMHSLSWKQSVVVSFLLYAAVAYVPSVHGVCRRVTSIRTNVCSQAAF